LARKIACKYAADGLRIFELGGAEVCFEQGPFEGAWEESSEATDNPKYQDCRRHLALWMSALSRRC
jgi:hypothetical protein